MKAINPNSVQYFMGFNAFTLKRPNNPFSFPSKAASDWLAGFVDAKQQKEQKQ